MDEQLDLQKIIEKSQVTDVPILLKAKEDAKRLVKDEPSAANLAALDKVQKMLRDAMEAQTGNDRFNTIKEVLEYLRNQGRKISQSQLYKDMNSGHLIREKDSSFKRSMVDKYAKTLKSFAIPIETADNIGELARQEQEERLAKIREQRLSITLDREIKQGKYVKRAEVDLELAGRAAILSLGLKSVFRISALAMISVVHGDHNKVEEFITLFEKNLDETLNEYSKPMDFILEVLGTEKGKNTVSEGYTTNDKADDEDE